MLEMLPGKEQIASIEELLGQLGWEQRLQAARGFAEIVKNLSDGFKGVEANFSHMETLLAEIGDKVATDEEIKEKLGELDRKRLAWVGRISSSQLDLLGMVPHAPTHVVVLWEKAKATILPESSALEFRFRLHELEWLGLLARHRSSEGDRDWLYWRVIEGRSQV